MRFPVILQKSGYFFNGAKKRPIGSPQRIVRGGIPKGRLSEM